MNYEYPRDRKPKTFVTWTPEMDAEIIRLTAADHSSRQIAEKFGVSRDAVLGRIFRLRQTGHHIPSRDAYKMRKGAVIAPQRPKPATPVARTRKTPSVRLPESGNGKRPIRIPRVLPKPVEIPTGNLCSILDVTGCKYPVRRCDKTVGKHLLCNAEKAENVPYCSHHLAVTWKPYLER